MNNNDEKEEILRRCNRLIEAFTSQAAECKLNEEQARRTDAYHELEAQLDAVQLRNSWLEERCKVLEERCGMLSSEVSHLDKTLSIRTGELRFAHNKIDAFKDKEKNLDAKTALWYDIAQAAAQPWYRLLWARLKNRKCSSG